MLETNVMLIILESSTAFSNELKLCCISTVGGSVIPRIRFTFSKDIFAVLRMI